MNFNYQIDPNTQDLIFTGRIASTELLSERIAIAIGQEIVRQVAEVIVLEKSAQIMSLIDMNAIANMVIAKAAADIASKITVGIK